MTDLLLVAFTSVIAVATVAAVFQDRIRARIWRPSVSVLMVSSRQDCHKTTGRDELTGDLRPVYSYRVRIQNGGKVPARDVEVFAKELKKADADNQWHLVERFIPQWLLWAVLRHPDPRQGIYLPVLHAGSTRHCDLAHVIHPAYRGNFGLEQDPEVDPDHVILSLDVAVRYQRLGHLLPRGRYQLTLEVVAANTSPVEYVVEISNPGTWHDDEETMLAHGVAILSVTKK